MIAYIKPKVVFLDDDKTLLDVLHYYFNRQFQNTAIVKTFSNSDDFFLYLNEFCYLPDDPLDIMHSFYDRYIDKHSIIKTLKDLSTLSATIVLDQELREESITGIDISATLREYFPASYIGMLTNNIHDNEAVHLHNNRSIDLFIDKKDKDAIFNLYKYISKNIEYNNIYYSDALDIFSASKNLGLCNYLRCKQKILEEINPKVFLTLNENGDIAFLDNNDAIIIKRYIVKNNAFVDYGY